MKLIQDTNSANLNQNKKDQQTTRKKKETIRKRVKQKAQEILISLMKKLKVANSVGMKTKTSTNKTIKSLRKTGKEVEITQNQMMNLMLLRKILNAEVKTKKVEGTISGTLSTMMRSTQDQPIQEEAEEQEATVVPRGVDLTLTLEMSTIKGRHQ